MNNALLSAHFRFADQPPTIDRGTSVLYAFLVNLHCGS
jgi:hypothetical protein